MRRIPIGGALALAVAWLLVALPAGAQLATTSFNVTAQVVAACTMTATDMDFGSIDLSSDAASSTTISIDCGQSLAAQLTLTSQTSTSASFQMAGSVGTLTYRICQQATCTTLAQSGVAFPVTLTALPNSLVLPATVPAGQVASPDTYSDVVQVSLDL